MAKSVNPILAQGLNCPYVKICSWTLTLELWYINIKVCSQRFYLIYLYGQGPLLRVDLSLCTMLLLTSPTLFYSLPIAFKKTTLFPADRDMWIWLTKTLLWPASSSCWNGFLNYQYHNLSNYQLWYMNSLFWQ